MKRSLVGERSRRDGGLRKGMVSQKEGIENERAIGSDKERIPGRVRACVAVIALARPH